MSRLALFLDRFFAKCIGNYLDMHLRGLWVVLFKRDTGSFEHSR
jgi:hypothetical protein